MKPQPAHSIWFVRFYRSFLWLYPPAFRQAYREPMLQVLQDAMHDGELRSPGILSAFFIDLIVSLCKENLRMLRHELVKRTLIFQALLLTTICSMFALAMYGTVQHALRSGANDPQFQMAGDAVTQLEQGADAASIVGPHQVDMTRSLAPFLIVYDSNGMPVASAAQLNGRAPKPPFGVFRHASEHHLNVLTWQPESGVRIAAVIEPYAGQRSGFVLAGRSLRVVEERESTTLQMVGLAWLGMMAIVLVATTGFAFLTKRESSSSA
jgi:hypothetical protein